VDIPVRIIVLSDSTTDQPHTLQITTLLRLLSSFKRYTSKIFVSLACRPYPASSQDNQQREHISIIKGFSIL
jgi:hypothetical protein